jgi:hypothetical protein
MSSAFEVRAGVVCDFVRREDNGKLIFIGVYSENIVPNKFPATLILTCVGIVYAPEPVRSDIEVRVLFDGESKQTVDGSIEVHKAGVLFLPIPNIRLKDLAGPGTLSFQIREREKHWQTMMDIEVGSPEST